MMLTPMRIQKVVASRFRGASRESVLEFDATKGFALVFGENGTGKSTMIDAIDAVLNQHCGSLEGRSSTRIGEHVPSIGSSASQVIVKLTAGGKTWTATLRGPKITVTPPSGAPSGTILRRNEILSLVDAQLAKRFEQLKSFIDVDCVQRSEDNLNEAIKRLRANIEQRQNEQTNAENALRQAYQDDHSPDEEGMKPREWAKKRLDVDLSQEERQMKELKAVMDAHTVALTRSGSVIERQKELDQKREKQEEVRKTIEGLNGLDAKMGVELVNLLNLASKYIGEAEKTGKCPVCLSVVEEQSLLDDIRRRLSEMAELTRIAREWESAKKAVENAEAAADSAYNDLLISVLDLVSTMESLGEDHKAPDRKAYHNLFGSPDKITKEKIDEATSYVRDATSNVEEIQRFHDGLQKRFNQQNSVRRIYETALKAEAEARKQVDTREILEAMHQIVRQKRIEFVQKVLDDVADECDRMYRIIHPDEEVGGVRFELDKEKKGSLHQSGRFAGHDGIVPQAYFSDSHLDTLGFCFFLAVAKKMTGGKTIIVLDDVFTTIDLEHIERILDLILAEVPNFNQVILATHQRRWLDFFQENRVSSQNACVVHLRRWSLDTGVCGDSVANRVTELQQTLEGSVLKRREIGSLSGFLLESVLDEMTKRLKCHIERKPHDKYTGYDLLCAITQRSKSIQVKKVNNDGNDVVVGPIGDIVNSLKKTYDDVRNRVGGHFNWDSADIADSEVKRFGEQTLELCRMFICQGCGGMAIKDRKTYLECSCKGLRIDLQLTK